MIKGGSFEWKSPELPFKMGEGIFKRVDLVDVVYSGKTPS
jgi:hypothetical protein